jgi:hypothetical protein
MVIKPVRAPRWDIPKWSRTNSTTQGRDEEHGTKYQCKDHDGKYRLVDGDEGNTATRAANEERPSAGPTRSLRRPVAIKPARQPQRSKFRHQRVDTTVLSERNHVRGNEKVVEPQIA